MVCDRLHNNATAHVGQLGFSIGLAFAVALIAHVAGLHELNQRARSFGLLARCFFVSALALLVVNAELLLVQRALIVGIADRNTYVAAIVGSSDYTDRAMKFLTQDEARGVKVINLSLDEHTDVNLRDWTIANGVDQVVVDTDDPMAPSQTELLNLIDGHLSVSTYTNFVENLFERVPNKHITAQWIIDTQSEHASLYKSTLKRVVDIVIASIALVLLSPLVLLAAIAVRLESPGPVIFKQVRVGQYGQLFTMFKLRSMRADAEKDGAQWASEVDNRVTKVGQFLRNSRLDEAPQLVNVIAGNMSLVGPRPERPEFTETLETNIPFFVHRLLVKPGITGWAQMLLKPELLSFLADF